MKHSDPDMYTIKKTRLCAKTKTLLSESRGKMCLGAHNKAELPRNTTWWDTNDGVKVFHVIDGAPTAMNIFHKWQWRGNEKCFRIVVKASEPTQ